MGCFTHAGAAVLVPCVRQSWALWFLFGFHPIAPARFSGDAQYMDNETRLIEAEFAAYLVAAAIVAFTLMVGHTMWKSMSRD